MCIRDSPNTYNTLAGAALVAEQQNSRVALLARDHVCVNATAFGARLDPDPTNTTGTFATGYWQMAPTNQVSFQFRSHQPVVSPMLYVRHAGQLNATTAAWNNGLVPPTYYPAVQLLNVGGTLLDWSWGSAVTAFSFNPAYAVSPPGPPSMTLSERVLGAALPAGQWEVSVRVIPETSLTTPATVCRPPTSVVASAGGVVGTNNNVLIGGFQILPSQVNIDALMYAQEGSWFVLPGPWFNGSWPYAGNYLAADPVNDTLTTGVRSYKMALGSIPLTGISPPSAPSPRPMLYINGAIAENHTASLGDAHVWLSRWSGPEVMLSQVFDGGLRHPAYQHPVDSNANLMRLPKMPVPAGVILWERE